ncbi:MAG: hypothetical protein EHM55_09110 [Acidobacteria bacterium]|nr:MAG: hypothetical protein EHM55_09110 [Acidobacteriota bacterium]
MLCPVCNQRKAKRACPALGRQICAVCCGTKRVVEINCPADCGYLSSARHHPPAVVQRQQELDRAMLLPLLQDLSERQARLFLMLAALTSRHQPEAFQSLVDDDIAQAAAALASTLETAGRGIVYEHRPSSLVASRLMDELKGMVDEVVKNAGSALERDAAIALRRIEHAAKAMSASASRSGASAQQPDAAGLQPRRSELQQLFARVLAPPPGAEQPDAAPSAEPSIIIP